MRLGCGESRLWLWEPPNSILHTRTQCVLSSLSNVPLSSCMRAPKKHNRRAEREICCRSLSWEQHKKCPLAPWESLFSLARIYDKFLFRWKWLSHGSLLQNCFLIIMQNGFTEDHKGLHQTFSGVFYWISWMLINYHKNISLFGNIAFIKVWWQILQKFWMFYTKPAHCQLQFLLLGAHFF